MLQSTVRVNSSRETLPRFIKTAPLKGGAQIVGKPDDFQVQCVGGEQGGRNRAQGKVFAQFADRCSPVVEVPDSVAGVSDRLVTKAR
jgi:hypothetical protein